MKIVPNRFTMEDEAKCDIGAYRIYYNETQVDQSCPLHWHTYYELELVTGGRGMQWINGHPIPVETGSLYLLSPTDLHRLEADAALAFISIKLPANGLPTRIEQLLNTNHMPCFTQLNGDHYALSRSDFQRIRRAMSVPSACGEAKVYALIMLLLATLFELSPPEQQYHPDIAFRRQYLVLQYIHSRYLSPLSLAEVSRVAELSPNHFCTQFVKVTGCGFVEYCTRLRIQYACTLLEDTEMSVTEISFASGFGSLSHFLRTFHKSKQMTPSAYRQAAKRF